MGFSIRNSILLWFSCHRNVFLESVSLFSRFNLFVTFFFSFRLLLFWSDFLMNNLVDSVVTWFPNAFIMSSGRGYIWDWQAMADSQRMWWNSFTKFYEDFYGSFTHSEYGMQSCLTEWNEPSLWTKNIDAIARIEIFLSSLDHFERLPNIWMSYSTTEKKRICAINQKPNRNLWYRFDSLTTTHRAFRWRRQSQWRKEYIFDVYHSD